MFAWAQIEWEEVNYLHKLTISRVFDERPDLIDKRSPLLKLAPEKIKSRLISFLCVCVWRDVFSSSFFLRRIYDSYYGGELAHE